MRLCLAAIKPSLPMARTLIPFLAGPIVSVLESHTCHELPALICPARHPQSFNNTWLRRKLAEGRWGQGPAAQPILHAACRCDRVQVARPRGLASLLCLESQFGTANPVRSSLLLDCSPGRQGRRRWQGPQAPRWQGPAPPHAHRPGRALRGCCSGSFGRHSGSGGSAAGVTQRQGGRRCCGSASARASGRQQAQLASQRSGSSGRGTGSRRGG